MNHLKLIFFALLTCSINILIHQKINYEFLFIIILLCFLYKNLYSKDNIKQSYRRLEILIPLINKLNIIKSIPKTNALNDYSASPDFLFSIVDIIEKYKPNIILEAGSGVSTIIASYGLKKYNPDGKIISLDHDKKYADTTKIEIKKHQLEQHSTIIHSPLIKYPKYKFKWYDIDNMIFENKIDLIIIDGPPSKSGKFARYPAIPLLLDKMSDKAIIVLDDAKRKNEQEVIGKWKEEFNCFDYQYENNDKGICIIKKIK